MSDAEERRLAELLRSGLPDAEPPERLWERSRGRYRRVRARRRAAGAVAAVVALLAVGLAIPRLVPGAPQERLVLDAPSVAEPIAPSQPAATEPSSTPPAPEPVPTPPASVSPDPEPTAAPPPSSPSPSPTACERADPPGDAQLREVGDVDGDGAADAVALAGGALQLVTGDGLVTPPLDVGAQPALGVGLADVDADGDADLFVRTSGRAGQRVTIARFDGCALAFLLNAQGESYAFDIGQRDGALVGMGCVDVDDDGALEVVGLEGRLDGDAYVVDRTVVDLRGDRAVNGAIDTVRVPAGDPRAVGLISSATCGERLLDDAVFG